LSKHIEERDTQHWNWKLWLWAFLCAAGIFFIAPEARTIQIFIYTSIGKTYITCGILFLIISGFLALLSFLIFKCKTRTVGPYAWLFLGCGLYAYFTFRLGKHPEEAAHFVEYALLAFFFFRALSHRIRDRTVYITTVLFTACTGIIDEFIQWLLPSRVWDYGDIGLNTLSSGIFVLILWKAVRPGMINQPLRKVSLRTLSGIITVTVILLGLCLSNTPEVVTMYTAKFSGLLWLRAEETMTGSGAVPLGLMSMWLLIVSLLVLVRVLGKQWEKRLEN
jgi:hypothetical protein